MLKQKNRFMALLCAGALALSVSAGAAAKPAETHAALWTERIYVDDVWVAFQNEQGKRTEAVSYNGTTYIPIRSAGEWMGCEVAWDQAQQAIRLTSGKTRTVTSNADTPGLSMDEIALYNQQKKNGVTITLRPDITVYLDGAAQNFQNVKGEPVYPISFANVTYLPVRNVGEMCGMKAAFVPRTQLVALFTPLTTEQRTAVQTYLSTIETAYGKLSAAMAEYTAALPTATKDTALAQLNLMNGYLNEMVETAADVPSMKVSVRELAVCAFGISDFGSVGSDIHALEQGRGVDDLSEEKLYGENLNTLKSAIDNTKSLAEALLA